MNRLAGGPSANCPAGRKMAPLLISLCLCAFVVNPVPAQQKRLVVIVVPGLKADDLTSPNLATEIDEVVGRGAIGWMNSRTARVPGQRQDSEEAAYVTLGAGSRACGGSYARTVSPEAIRRIRRDNDGLDHPVRVGALGDLLHTNGLRTGVDGAEDDVEPRRAGLLIAANTAGRVDVNRTDQRLWVVDREWNTPASAFPYGILQENTGAFASGSGPAFEVRIWGDLARADRYSNLCTPALASAHRQSALFRLGRLIRYTDNELEVFPLTRFILLAPCPADSAEPGDRLAPIMMWGDGVQPGLLTSGSAQTPGLVANTDFLPTVAEYFGIKPPPGMVGRPMQVSLITTRHWHWRWAWPPLWFGSLMSADYTSANAGNWASLHSEWMVQARKQSAFGGLPTLQSILIVVGWAAIMFGGDRYVRVGAAAALAIASIPVVLLLLPPLSPQSLIGSGVLLGIGLMVCVAPAVKTPGACSRLAIGFTAALAITTTLDLLTGAHLMRGAWMSYSVMEGARYYGIGNEYASAYFVCAMVVITAWLRGGRMKAWSGATAAGLFVAAIVGWPSMGANAGGFLGCAIGFAAAAHVWRGGRIRAREMVMPLAITAAVLGVMLLADLSRTGGAQTHIARSLGANPLGIAARKAELNLYLLFHSSWSLVLLAAALGLWSMLRSPQLALYETMRDDRALLGGAAGIVAGSAALLIFNDSGVVAAAEALSLAWAVAAGISVAALDKRRAATHTVSGSTGHGESADSMPQS